MYVAAAQRATLVHHSQGGVELQADALYRGLVAREHTVEVITTAHPSSLREAEEVRLVTHYLPRTDERRWTREWWRASYAKLDELVYRGRADVLLSQGAAALSYLPRARRELKLPAVLVVHTGLGDQLQAAWRAARSGQGVLRVAGLLSQMAGWYAQWRRAVAAADAVIVHTEEAVRTVRAESGGDRRRVQVVAPGVDLARFAPSLEARQAGRAELALSPEQFLAVTVSRLVPERGLGVVVEALARVPEATLLIVGDGPDGERLHRLAQARRLGTRVRFYGAVPRERVPALLAAADAFVMPTLCREGLPLAVVEALACGLPVVASRLDGIPTAVRHERTGLLVPPGDARAWAAALGRMARDATLRAQLAAAARADAEARFGVERMVDDTLAVLERAVAARPRVQGRARAG